MKKILVAGAGHGGVTAAINLARAGYDVTVLEAKKREDLGWDWHDVLRRDAFSYTGIDLPDEKHFGPFEPMGYYGPSKTTHLVTDTVDESIIHMDRKYLIAYLIEQAEQAGVRFLFEAAVTGPVADTRSVKGLWVDLAGVRKKLYADLVIDAAGMHSPVRMNLPVGCGVQNEISEADTFHVYRAYFDRAGEGCLEPKYCVYFFHCGKPGMDWLITNDDYMDVLVGSIGPMPDGAVEDALADFRETYPYVGEKLLRGGQTATIPLRRTLAVYVANGYAAVGDSAAMTEPMSGSGITLSMKAGKILADVVIEAGDADLTVDRLWPYEYRYAREMGDRFVSDDLLIHLVLSLTADDIDHFLNSHLITSKELENGGMGGYSFAEVIQKAQALLAKPAILPLLMKFVGRSSKAPKVIERMPEVYSKEAVTAWAEEYNALRE